jgi:two-component system, CAI-1 autoinducer sensor kinase/phosphatase CqsS
MMTRVLQQLKDWIILPEMEIILHPSRRRLQWLGVLTIIGHAIFWLLWTHVFPQPYEDWLWRLLMAITGLPLVFLPKGNLAHSRSMKWYFSFACWIQLPFFFVWMYFMNANSSMWMATVAVMIVVYNNLTDWRAATLGLIFGALASAFFSQFMLGYWPPVPTEHFLVFGFSWVFASLLAFSSANLRRERLRHSLNVIGIMAHELRTPLATMALIAQALRIESLNMSHPHEVRLEELATRIDALTRAINHHIDSQMANARYEHQLLATQSLSAQKLVQQVLQDYPFGSKRERQCVQVVLHSDFWFRGSARQFTQVLDNLIKNAMHSLKTAQSRYSYGDLRIEVGMRNALGRIQITDQGVGVHASQLKLIFEPFFSTANETGHGLGLAFCKQVVEAAHGTIMVHSEPAMGATFTLQLPCQPAPSEENPSHHEISPLSPT